MRGREKEGRKREGRREAIQMRIDGDAVLLRGPFLQGKKVIVGGREGDAISPGWSYIAATRSS